MADSERFIQKRGLERSRDVVGIKTTCEQMKPVAVE